MNIEHIGHYLREIHFNRKSGRLAFKYKNIQKLLFFQNGFLVFTKTNQVQELLGEFLFRMKKISEEVYSKIEQFIEPMQSIGKTLVESGIITKKDLHAGLMYQMRETTLNMFPIFQGNFRFQEKRGYVEGEFGTKINIPDLIEEGIRRMTYTPEIKKLMESKVPVPKTRECIDRLTKQERELLRTIDGSCSATALLRSTNFRSRPFWKTLYLFYCLNLIDLQEEGRVMVTIEKGKKAAADDSEKRIAEVLALSENLSKLDYHKLLDVAPTASQNEIKIAYFNLARRYHPDRFDLNIPSETKKKIEKVFGQITKAYQVLSSGEEISDFGLEEDTISEVDKMDIEKRSEIKYRQAKTLYTQERYDEALVLLEEALRLKRNKASYILLLAMTETKIPFYKEKAEDDFLRAIDLEPWNAEAYVSLGVFYKNEGLKVKAKKMFKKALEMEPEHKLALKELAEAEPPEKKKKGIKEIFRMDLLGKKKKEKEKASPS